MNEPAACERDLCVIRCGNRPAASSSCRRHGSVAAGRFRAPAEGGSGCRASRPLGSRFVNRPGWQCRPGSDGPGQCPAPRARGQTALVGRHGARAAARTSGMLRSRGSDALRMRAPPGGPTSSRRACVHSSRVTRAGTEADLRATVEPAVPELRLGAGAPVQVHGARRVCRCGGSTRHGREVDSREATHPRHPARPVRDRRASGRGVPRARRELRRAGPGGGAAG